MKTSQTFSKARICLCSEFPPPYGGIALQAKLLADALEKEDRFEIRRLSTTLPDSYFCRKLGKVRGVRGFVRSLVFICRSLFEFPKSSIVHILTGSYLNFFIFTFPAIISARLFGKPVVLHYHGGAAGEFLKRWGMCVRPALQMANVIVTPSGFLDKVFSMQGYSTTIIPNIIQLDKFIFKERRIFKPRILMTRHLEPIYNVSCAIRSFVLLLEDFPEAVLTIAGSGSEKNMLEELAIELGCEQQITFLGAVNPAMIYKLYEENDILLNTSNVDNLPLSILEGFACGLLVVSTSVGGIPYLIKHKENGLLVDQNDHEGVTEELSWVLNNPRASLVIANHAYKNISFFLWPQVRPLFYRVYDQLL